MESYQSLSSIVFLGTGSSTGVPSMKCLLRPSNPPCKVCSYSLSVPPEYNPNYSFCYFGSNPSLLVVDYCPNGSEHKYILIDVGKTFKEQVLRWFTRHNIPWIDSIILTHEHADAILGLDDIRELQHFGPTVKPKPMPVYLNQFTFDSITLKFPYLVPREAKDEIPRSLSQIGWKIIESCCDKPFVASGLKFIPLPVMHGEDYISLGFLFGENYRIAYISCVSRIPESTEYVISEHGAGQLDLLILDANTTKQLSSRSAAHFHLEQTLNAVRRIVPKRSLLVGMNHSFDHDNENEFLAQWYGIQVQLAYDGLRLFIDL